MTSSSRIYRLASTISRALAIASLLGLFVCCSAQEGGDMKDDKPVSTQQSTTSGAPKPTASLRYKASGADGTWHLKVMERKGVLRYELYLIKEMKKHEGQATILADGAQIQLGTELGGVTVYVKQESCVDLDGRRRKTVAQFEIEGVSYEGCGSAVK